MPRGPAILGLVLAVAASPAALADLPVDLGEEPDQGVCAGRVVGALVTVVCAFAGTGTSASCSNSGTTPLDASCSHTRSYAWRAFSPAQLPGEARVTVVHTVRVCEDRVGAPPACTVDVTNATTDCTWTFAGACRDALRIDGTTGPVALAMGEQLSVHVDVRVTMDASAGLDGFVERRSVHWADASLAGAAVEVRDDGRAGGAG